VHTQTHAKFISIIKICSADFLAKVLCSLRKWRFMAYKTFHKALKLDGFFGMIPTVIKEHEN
jgi:hypothetical protein